MKNGQVTSPSEAQIVPVVYVDLTIDDTLQYNVGPGNATATLPQLIGQQHPLVRFTRLSAGDIDSDTALYRFEGPLPSIIDLVRDRIHTDPDQVLVVLANAKLAR